MSRPGKRKKEKGVDRIKVSLKKLLKVNVLNIIVKKQERK